MNQKTELNTIIVKETPDLSIYRCEINGEKKFIKEATSEAGAKMNEREFNNQKFLQKITAGKAAGFEFLSPALEDKKLVFPDVTDTVTWLATGNLPGTEMAPLPEYQEEMLKFVTFCLNVKYADIPDELKKDSHERMAGVLTNFETDLKGLLEKNLLKELDTQKLRDSVKGGIHRQAFQHHDVVPWHMARKHADGRLILVDAGWSGWSLKYMDIAYFVLQMLGYAERENDAVEFLNITKENFKNNPEFQKELLTPLAYRGVRLAAELLTQGKRKNAQGVLSFVLSEIKVSKE